MLIKLSITLVLGCMLHSSSCPETSLYKTLSEQSAPNLTLENRVKEYFKDQWTEAHDQFGVLCCRHTKFTRPDNDEILFRSMRRAIAGEPSRESSIDKNKEN